MIHPSIASEINAHAVSVTGAEMSGQAELDGALAADGAHNLFTQTGVSTSSDVLPLIQPPANVVFRDQPTKHWRDQIVKYTHDKGIHAFHKNYGHGKRAIVVA